MSRGQTAPAFRRGQGQGLSTGGGIPVYRQMALRREGSQAVGAPEVVGEGLKQGDAFGLGD